MAGRASGREIPVLRQVRCTQTLRASALAAAAVIRVHRVRVRGFTLLELLSALLIFGVLLTVALPAWQAHTFRIERTAALAGLQRAAQCQAKQSVWETLPFARPDTRCLPRDTGAYRFLAVPTGTPADGAYEWRAEPLGRQRGDACGTLVLDHRGQRAVLGTAEHALRCWQGR